MNAKLLVLVAIIALAPLSGCLKKEETPTTTTTSSTGPVSPTGTSGSATNTTSAAPVTPIANLTANVTNGSAPLLVSFAITDDNEAPGNVTWVLEFGDGNSTNGTSLPGRTNHTYNATGNFSAILTITSGDDDSSDNETITVTAGAAGGPPSQTEYESGPVVGYVSEGGYDNCPAYLAGPGNEGGLGLWIELEPGHVGMTFEVSGTAGGDSDGWLFAESDAAPLSEDINNGGGEATGVIPPEAKWMLIVSWATPSENMVVTFTPTA